MKNFPNTKQLGDVTQLDTKTLPQIDLLIGGSPCQGFSFAGKQMNFDDPRSKLFFEFVRILKEVKPKYFLFENVVMKKEYRDIISNILGVEPIKINSSLLSAAKRNRLYWSNIPNLKIPHDKEITFDDINLNDQHWLNDEYIERVKKWNAKQKPLNNVTYIGKKNKLPCLTARGYNQNHSGMILISDGHKFRYLTDNEAELAMTLPIDYTNGIPKRQRSRCIGNGWTVDIISHLFKNLKKCLENDTEPISIFYKYQKIQ